MSTSKSLVIATRNEGKLREFRSLLSPHGFEVVGIADRSPDKDPEESGTSFAKATRESFGNVFANVGISSISAEETADKAAERAPLKEVLKGQFTPLAAYAFIVFVLLYMPCVIASVAMVQEFGTWKWYGIAFAYQMALAWGMAALVYQGGRLLGLGG